uniref:Variant surface glycoprotein 1125.2867 n=1 Tax=Trypanosoma brucei TaxID=5691 RepID=A0A1J0R504_9TRYP|nr:variant surface glycoprotein 1125.2867 [Trypanosoma brucei]
MNSLKFISSNLYDTVSTQKPSPPYIFILNPAKVDQFPKPMYKQLLILLALSVKLAQSADDVTVGGNRQAYSALCGIVALAEGDINLPPEPAITSDDYDFVQLLNLSSSGDEWQKMFYTNDTPKKVHNTADEAGEGKKGYEEYWEDWKKAAEQLLTTPKPPRLEATGINKLTPAQRKPAHSEIAKLAGKAIQIKKQIDGLDAGQVDSTSAAAILKTAVYGGNAGTADSTTLVTAFGADPENTARGTVCVAGSGNQRVKTVAPALECLCVKAAAGGGRAIGRTQPAQKKLTAVQGGTAAAAHITSPT